MKVKNFVERLVGDHNIDVIFESNPDKGTIRGETCCNYCAADKYGNEKISQFLIDGSGDITLILKKANVILRDLDEDDEDDYDVDFYDDDE